MRKRALVVLAAFSVSACAGTDSMSTATPSGAELDSPAEAPIVAATPSVAPTASATPTPPGLAVNSVAQVVTTDLVMRSAPGGGENSIIFPGVLDAPTLLFVVDGPVTESGYDWYLAAPFSPEGGLTPQPSHWRMAWLAAGSREGEPWIAPATLECPDPSLDALMSLTSLGTFACFGASPLSLEGTFGGCSYVVPGTIGPSWLGSEFCSLHLPGTPREGLLLPPQFLFHIPKGSAAESMYDLEPGTAIRLTGQFDHEAAQTCVQGPLPGPEPTPMTAGEELLAAQGVILSCRAHFVTSDYETLP